MLDNATEAGRMAFGKVTESKALLPVPGASAASRYCNPYSGNREGSVENAVGFLRRNLLVPVPVADSLDELFQREARVRLRPHQRRSEERGGQEDRGGAPGGSRGHAGALPGTPFDAVRWAHARADGAGTSRWT